MYLARQLSRKQKVIHSFTQAFLPLVFPIALTVLLIAPANLSTAMLTGATGMLLLFLGRIPIKYLLLMGAVALVPILFLLSLAAATYQGPDAAADTQQVAPANDIRSKGRVGTWVKRIQDFRYAKGEEVPYQLQQAKIAIAKGGWTGLGPGNSEQRNFLPHPYSDFIFSIIIEEYGLMGGFVIMMLYLIFLYRSILLLRKSPRAFGAFLALALSITLVIQACINMAVNVGLFPITGVTLPLVSMGGTSFLFTCFAIGIILSVSRHIQQLEGAEPQPVPVAAEATDVSQSKEEVSHG
jgi:cell division protein FtsW